MARAGVSRLTLASSMVVYGEGVRTLRATRRGEAGAPAGERSGGRSIRAAVPACGQPLATELVSESAPFDPRNAYASSKVAQEFYGGNWARATGGSVAAMRYHNVYGPGMPRDTPYAGVAAIFISALRRGEAPSVFEDGRQRRDFVHVRDVAAATVLACEKHRRRACVPTMSARARRERWATWRGRWPRRCKGPAPVVTGQYRLGDVRHITADSSRLRDELQWRPRVDFAAGMAELAAAS